MHHIAVTFPYDVDAFLYFTLYLNSIIFSYICSAINLINKWFLSRTLFNVHNSTNIKNQKLVFETQDLSFDIFNGLYRKKYNSNIDPDWLGWFVGFVEGDGYLGKDNTGLVFVITQKESKILFEIQNTLKFGTVKNFGGFSRYMVHGKDDILLLFHIFNGNLHLIPRINQLIVWAEWLNDRYIDNPLNVVTKPVQLLFNNSWFSGFIDAEGCFNVYVAKNKYMVTMRFIVDQKDGWLLFESLKNRLGSGSIYSRKNNNVRYVASNLLSLNIIINYLGQFPLKTKKYLAFNKWFSIYSKIVKKEHKTPEGFANIKKLSLEINKDND